MTPLGDGAGCLFRIEGLRQREANPILPKSGNFSAFSVIPSPALMEGSGNERHDFGKMGYGYPLIHFSFISLKMVAFRQIVQLG